MSEIQTTEKKGKARENYSHKKLDVRIQKRRDAAIDRQAKYDVLTTDEKIRLAHSRRGNSKRELERLMTKVKESSAPAAIVKKEETKTEKKKGKKKVL